MEALILTSALLALARFFMRKKDSEDGETSPPREPTVVVPAPPPPPPPPAPTPGQGGSRPAGGAPDRARLERAHGLAVQVAKIIETQGRAHDGKVVRAFQAAAGLRDDGDYGPRTAGAVQWYTGKAIAPLIGRGFESYAPFGSSNAAASPSNAKKPAPKAPPLVPPTAPPKTAAPPVPARPSGPPPNVTPAEKPRTPPPPKSDPPRVPAIASAAPSTPSIPDTARLDRAAALAKRVAESVKTAGKNYDRELVASFQREAGLVDDKQYGPRSAGAVKWYIDETVLPPSGGGLIPYAPKLASPVAKTEPKPSEKAEPKSPEKTEAKPPEKKPDAPASPPVPVVATPSLSPSTSVVRDRARLDRAAELAKRAALNLKEPADAYNRPLMEEFQREAGLKVDGKYGPKSAGAVKWFTGESITPKLGRGFIQYVPNF